MRTDRTEPGRAWRATPLAAFGVVALAACATPETRDDDTSADEATAAGAEASAASQSGLRVASAPGDACGWIPAEEVASVVGALAGAPEVVRSADDDRPHRHGAACRYRLARQPAQGAGEVIVQVTLNDGPLVENALGQVRQRFEDELADIASSGAAAPGSVRDATTSSHTDPGGWDFEGMLPARIYAARVGHVGVKVATRTSEVPREAMVALAARVRDRMPDLPFALPPDPILAELDAALGDAAPPPLPAGPDPCGLLTRAEAEAVLGRLVVPPYRSSGDSPLADPHGESCAYYTGRHRALVLKPTWTGGEMLFGMAGGVEDLAASILPGGEEADTLDGPWDQVIGSGATGTLRFLMADRMLEVIYATSSTDFAGAVRLARSAVARL